ncbi:mechanosensitive ion channel family protein [Helicobacter canis]|uniref:Mechanosensitive ion channel family protein n=1 Tax=Helicobacter canis TaxID=29419 RepID=A0A5M9QT90_9HELI|nr:mechanosensitive ion channel family protein [Helicobacter canis]KAA8710982.1 mechanosensitive ion channel family protein [Helicobacter canis]
MKKLNALWCATMCFPYFIYATSHSLSEEGALLEHKLQVLLANTLLAIESILPTFCANLMCAKILLSLAIFALLWLCRSSLARLVIYLIDMLLHLSRQDVQTRKQIQQSLMKPISLFLFVVSINISLDVLYYPAASPRALEVWFKIAYVVNGAWFVIIVSQGYVATFLTNLAQKKTDHFRKEVINLLLKIGYFIIVVIALLWILKILGFNISAIIASLGLGGLAVALAVKDMLANFFASVMLLFDNSFSQGERIECGGVDGVVVEMGLRRTTIRTGDNALVLIPNAELANKSITNWSRRKAGRHIRFSIGLTYGTPPDKILQCIESIKAMLLAHPLIAKESTTQQTLDYTLHLKKNIISLDDYLGYKHSVYVVLDELADSSMNILVYCFSKGVSLEEYLLAKEQVIVEILRIIDNLGLSLAFPSQSLYVESLPQIDDTKPSS